MPSPNTQVLQYAADMDVQTRFLQKVRVLDTFGCWEWTGARQPYCGVKGAGYGTVAMNGASQLAHRVAFKLLGLGEPGSLCVLHTCDNPACVNPSHLFLGTHKDNSDDKIAKGRLPSRRGVLNGRAKLTEAKVKEIIAKLWAGWGKRLNCKLGREYGVDNSVISDIKLDKIWADIPRPWNASAANG